MIRSFLFIVVSIFISTSALAADVPFRPFRSVANAVPHLVDRGGLRTLGIGALMLAGARDLDEDMQERFAYQTRLGGYESLGNEVFGRGIPGLLLGAGLWTYGTKSDDARTIHAGQATIESISSTFVATSIVKGGANRLRPDSTDRFSFPSGHTSTVFAVSGVLHQFYDWKVGAACDAIGLLTALSRVTANKHWFSDTVGGGLLGFSIGRAIARAHLEDLGEIESANDRQAAFTLVPMIDGESLGFGIDARF